MKPFNVPDLEKQLHQPSTMIPPGLHGDIMRAVRQTQPEPHPTRLAPGLCWAWVAGAALVIGLGAMLLRSHQVSVSHRPLPGFDPLAAARTVTPALPTTPFTEEAANLGSDARQAADFLLANLPSI